MSLWQPHHRGSVVLTIGDVRWGPSIGTALKAADLRNQIVIGIHSGAGDCGNRTAVFKDAAECMEYLVTPLTILTLINIDTGVLSVCIDVFMWGPERQSPIVGLGI